MQLRAQQQRQVWRGVLEPLPVDRRRQQAPNACWSSLQPGRHPRVRTPPISLHLCSLQGGNAEQLEKQLLGAAHHALVLAADAAAQHRSLTALAYAGWLLPLLQGREGLERRRAALTVLADAFPADLDSLGPDSFLPLAWEANLTDERQVGRAEQVAPEGGPEHAAGCCECAGRQTCC